MTGTGLFDASSLTVWPQGAPRPTTTTLALAPGRPVAQTVVTKLGNGGAVSLGNVSGLADATVDVVGWFPESSPLVSGNPQRLLDTRPAPVGSTADGAETGPGPLGAGDVRSFRVAGRAFAPVPAGSSVLLDVVGTGASAPTAITAWGAGPRPASPTLLLAPGETLPTTTVVPIGPDGSVSVANQAGRADVLVDVLAVLPASVGTATTPARLFDSRVGDTPGGGGLLTPGTSRTVPVLGRGTVPATGVSSVMLDVTGFDPETPAAIGVWGAGPPPTTSAVVVPARGARSGFAVVPVSPEGTVTLAVAGAAAHVTLDAVGWFAGTPAPALPTTASGVPLPGADAAAPAPDGGSVLWSADYAQGLAAYRSTPWNIVGAPTPQVVPAVSGGPARPALQFTMPGGGQRSELEPNFRSLRDGDDLWFGFGVTLAPGFPATTDDWQVITQWKNEGTGSPPLSIKVGKGQFLLDGGFDRGAPFQIPMGPATVGVRHTVVTHVVFRGGGGSVDTWVDGKQTITGFRPPAGTLYGGLASYLKTGIYRNTAIGQPGTLWFDDYRIATSYGAAFPR